MNMEYNTTRKPLIIPEYGRNIQEMIQYACTIEDRDQRLKAAKIIINVMAQMHPQTKDSVDYKHKLWDHLYIISDFKIDVDAPTLLLRPSISAQSPKGSLITTRN